MITRLSSPTVVHNLRNLDLREANLNKLRALFRRKILALAKLWKVL